MNLIRIACSDNRSAGVAAGEIGDRIEGRARQAIDVADVTADFRDRSDAELEFFIDRGFFPEEKRQESAIRW